MFVRSQARSAAECRPVRPTKRG